MSSCFREMDVAELSAGKIAVAQLVKSITRVEIDIFVNIVEKHINSNKFEASDNRVKVVKLIEELGENDVPSSVRIKNLTDIVNSLSRTSLDMLLEVMQEVMDARTPESNMGDVQQVHELHGVDQEATTQDEDHGSSLRSQVVKSKKKYTIKSNTNL
jgi:hypothetical protein